jgi:hypothetical protein
MYTTAGVYINAFPTLDVAYPPPGSNRGSTQAEITAGYGRWYYYDGVTYIDQGRRS